MATIKQVKNELRHKGWAEEIAECQSSGMRISEWCHMNGISCNTYYRRLRIVRNQIGVELQVIKYSHDRTLFC